MQKLPFNKASRVGQLKEYLVKYKTLLISLSILSIGASAWIGFSFKKKYEQERKEVVEALAEVQYLMEKKQYDKAREGQPGIYPGLTALSKQSIRNKALRNLVNSYIAIIYKERKHYEEALIYLKSIQMSDLFMQACVKCLEGDVHAEIANYDQALACYLEAAKYKPNEFFTPSYLIKAAGVYEKQGAYNKAIACYQEIMDKYPNCRKYTDAIKHSARLSYLQAKAQRLV